VLRHYHRYGSPQVREELRRIYGKRVSLKKVAALMRENGLNARRRGKFIPATNSNHTLEVRENRLNREFQAEQGERNECQTSRVRIPGAIGCTLTVVLDLYDRKVIGRAFSADMGTVHTTISAIRMAFAHRAARDRLLFHSGRGVRYCARAFREALCVGYPTVRQSMSRKGNCRDNVCAKSFFKTLKRELETLDGKHSAGEVRQSVFMYLEACYNRVRMHSTLDYKAPLVFNSRQAA
jgi:transposase InsO family protein